MGAKKGTPKPPGSGRIKGQTNASLYAKHAAQARSIELENQMKQIELSEREMALAIKRKQFERYMKTNPRFDGELAKVEGREFFSTANEFANTVLRTCGDGEGGASAVEIKVVNDIGAGHKGGRK